MPIARFEMPDGKIGRFEVPEGTTPEQAQSLIAESLQPQETAKPQTRMEAALEALKNPIGVEGKTRIVGPMIMGGLGETIKGAGAASQLLPESVISPETSQNIINVGRAMTQGSSKEFPMATGAGQIASYLAPAAALQKGINAIKSVPQAANIIGKIPSYALQWVNKH